MAEQIIGEIPAGGPEITETVRPWGRFRQYAHNYPVTVSLMEVKEGQRLSLQSHPGRGELWIVLDDGGTVNIGEEQWEPKAGDEIWIPANGKHRLGSLKGTVRVLEVAFGNWQQDDIVRYEDDYARPEHGE
ncbi:MAG: phosphomannose isomerase type II C-terminal cupin domain [Bifidobacteriaceae bacterium]|jgi:mannose-1-phosphate guanylyltransferase/mannose-6-phosphate isomerase|nr:phosphomannose isomerase type II C-terminal cupin domain [Bifidobacteriaceae bacterium]